MDRNIIFFMSAVSLMSTNYVTSVNLSTEDESTYTAPYEIPVTHYTVKKSLFKRLQEISKLKLDWDGYNAIPIKEETINNVALFLDNLKDKHLNLINEEDIVPSSYGTITIYFEDQSNNEVSVEIGEDLIGLTEDINGNEEYIDDLPFCEFPNVIENHLIKLSKRV